jgi:hypothetical protein
MSSGPTPVPALRRLGPGRRALAVVLSLAVLTPAGCAARSGDANPGVGEASVEWAGLRLEVRLPRSPADRLRAVASATNVSDRFLVREIPFCVAVIRLYRGDRLAWDQGREGCVGRRIVRLAVGETETHWTTVRAEQVPGADSGEEGSFTVRAYWPPERHPRMPPRTAMEVTVGEIRLEPR